MLTRCRARQDNVVASDGKVEAIADTVRFAEEPIIVDVYPAPTGVEMADEVAKLGLHS